jgi:hypothetical protein
MRYCVLSLIASLIGSSAFADGLVFQLPPDRTWARYAVKHDGEFGHGNEPKQKLTGDGAVTVSSVGQVTRNEQKCRWIEVKQESKAHVSGDGDVSNINVLKMLVPEDRLQRGQDPLSRAHLAYFNPKDGDKVGLPVDVGFNRIQYEIDRFRNVFPKPLDNSQSLARETVETLAGKFEDCKVLTGISDYDGPLINEGRMAYKTSYRILVHPKAPFGVVSMEIDSEGREFGRQGVVSVKFKAALKLMEIGKDAVSDLDKKTTDKSEK